MSGLEFCASEYDAGASTRCFRHRTGDELPIELRVTDVPPYECCDCVAERDQHIEDSLRFQERMELGIGEFERYGESV
jgi:hypothetical protein